MLHAYRLDGGPTSRPRLGATTDWGTSGRDGSRRLGSQPHGCRYESAKSCLLTGRVLPGGGRLPAGTAVFTTRCAATGWIDRPVVRYVHHCSRCAELVSHA